MYFLKKKKNYDNIKIFNSILSDVGLTLNNIMDHQVFFLLTD